MFKTLHPEFYTTDNGIIICDDYEWYKQDLCGPKPGIDAFLNIFINSYDLLFKEYQVGIKKR
jgi:hypothetical protein